MSLVAARLFQAALTVCGALSIVFLILRLTPGDPALIMLGDYATPDLVATVRQQYGLDKSIPEQFLVYVASIATGHLGNSLFLKTNVLTLLAAALPSTATLAVASMLVTTVVGIPLGVISALRRGSVVDFAAMLIAMLGAAAPSFWVALLMIYFLSFKLGWFPVQGVGAPENPLDQIYHLILPAFALGIHSAALVARTTRAAMLDVLSEQYVRTARAKGLREFRVIWRHVFRNSLIPVVTVLGIYFGQLLGGATVIEIVFGRPGVGKLLVDSILQRDYPLSQGLIIAFLVAVVLTNLVTDMLYGVIDPRIRTAS